MAATPKSESAAHQQSHDRLTEKRTHAWISDTLQAPTREELAHILTHLRLCGLVNPRVLAVFSHAWGKMPVQRSIYDSDSDDGDDVNAQWHDGFQNDDSMCKHIGQVDTHMACFLQPDPVQPTQYSCLLYDGYSDRSWLFANQFGAECKRQAVEMVTQLVELMQQHQPHLVSTHKSAHTQSPSLRLLPGLPPAERPLCVFQILALCKLLSDQISAGSCSIDSLGNTLTCQSASAFRAELGKLIKSTKSSAAPNSTSATVQHAGSPQQPSKKRQFVTPDMHSSAREVTNVPAWSW